MRLPTICRSLSRGRDVDLREQLSHLADAILKPIATEFPDPLSESDRALVSAYLVLSHAVLEEALEDAFTATYDRLAMSLGERLVPIEAARFVYSVCRWVPESVHSGQNPKNLHPFISKACRREFTKKIDSNNGLKTANIKSLSKLLGLDWDAIEDLYATQLADLDNLGSKRGAAGHLSPYSAKATGLTANVDPQDVRRWVDSGLAAITAVQQYLSSIASKASQPTEPLSVEEESTEEQ